MCHNFKLMVGHTTKHIKHGRLCDIKIWWPSVEMSHLGWALKRHLNPRFIIFQCHTHYHASSVSCLFVLYTSWAFINHLLTMCHIIQYVSRTCSFKRKKFYVQCTTTTTTVLRPLYRSTCVSRHFQLRTGGHFVGSKFYCPHALAGGNQRIRIREFSSTVLSTLSPYLW